MARPQVRQIGKIAAAVVLVAAGAAPARAQQQLSGPSFVGTGFSGTTFRTVGGEVQFKLFGRDIWGAPLLTPDDVFHLFIADANGNAVLRVLDYNLDGISVLGGLTISWPQPSYSNGGLDDWVSLGAFGGGSVLRFGFFADVGSLLSYDAFVERSDPGDVEMGTRLPGGASFPAFPGSNLHFRLTGVDAADNRINSAPEPATIVLLGTGLLGIGAARLRRRKLARQ
jgi:hypothetical protein